jgi:outer membrane protein OmpA-like peptidoglycan-associated protein
MTRARALLLAAPALALGVALSSPSSAGPAYKATDIVSHFAPPEGNGQGRALCIGTETECAKKGLPKPKPASNFDLVVNFDYNSATLTKPARENLGEFAKALKDPRLGATSFVVEGHTDGKGGADYNLDLSTRRANAVVEYLKEHGVEQTKLEPKGYGAAKPIAPDPLAAANRRVETRLRAE